MPSTEIEFNDRYESTKGIVNLGHREESFGVSHEAVTVACPLVFQIRMAPLFYSSPGYATTYFVIRSSIDLGSNMNVGSTTLLKSAPGRSWLIM